MTVQGLQHLRLILLRHFKLLTGKDDKAVQTDPSHVTRHLFSRSLRNVKPPNMKWQQMLLFHCRFPSARAYERNVDMRFVAKSYFSSIFFLNERGAPVYRWGKRWSGSNPAKYFSTDTGFHWFLCTQPFVITLSSSRYN